MYRAHFIPFTTLSFIRLVYYEKLVWEFLSALFRQEENAEIALTRECGKSVLRSFVKL